MELLRYKKGVKYSLIDLETYSLCLSLGHNVFWQASILEVVEDKVTKSKNLFIDWQKKDIEISSEAARVTNYYSDAVQANLKNCISLKEAFEEIDKSLQWADYVVGQNIIAFDLPLIADFYRNNKKDWKFIVPKIIDTKCIAWGIKTENMFDANRQSFVEYQVKMSTGVSKGVKTSLGVLCKDYGVEYDKDKAHDALYDLEVNLKVWNKMKWDIEV